MPNETAAVNIFYPGIVDFALVVVSAALAWLVTHGYYRAQRSQQIAAQDLLERQLAILDKLPESIKHALQSDERAALTVVELRTLLDEKTIEVGTTEFFPYKACPHCGATSVVRDEDWDVDVEQGEDGGTVASGTPFPTIECAECGWFKSPFEERHPKTA